MTKNNDLLKEPFKVGLYSVECHDTEKEGLDVQKRRDVCGCGMGQTHCVWYMYCNNAYLTFVSFYRNIFIF